MGSLTASLPKPMLPVAGKPLLEHVLERLIGGGIESVLLVVGYRREMIENYFRSYRIPITFAVQERIEGTARATALGRDFAADEPVLLTFGDILCSADGYRAMIDRFTSDEEAAGVLGVRHVDDPWQGAAVYEENGIVRRIIEKPPKGTSTTSWNSAGLYVFDSELFDYLDKVQLSSRGEYELTSAIGDMLADGRRLLLHPVTGQWRDVGRPEDLEEVERWLQL